MRHPTSTSYLQLFKSDGTVMAPSFVEFGRGSYTLVAGTTYFAVVGGQDNPVLSCHFRWDAALVITTATPEACDFPPSDVDWYDDTGGEWLAKSASAMLATVVGAGVTNTNGVVAASGGAVGGCRWDIFNHGARRTRIKIVVGATGGELVPAGWGKD